MNGVLHWVTAPSVYYCANVGLNAWRSLFGWVRDSDMAAWLADKREGQGRDPRLLPWLGIPCLSSEMARP